MSQKLQQLPPRTTPANTDLLYLVVPGAGDPDRRIPLSTRGAAARAAGVVAFPAAADSPGAPGDIAYGQVGGVDYIAVYTGDGQSHSWLFAASSTIHPDA